MPGDVERAAAHAALVAAAVDLLRDLDAGVAAANIQRADALRAVELVRREREHVDVVLLDIDRNLADSLDSIGVEENALLVAELADLGDGLDDADLVVRVHNRHEDGLVGAFANDGVLQLVERDKAVGLGSEIGDAVALFLQLLAGIEDCLVLGGLGDDVVAALAVHLRDALDGEIIGLGSAGGEDDLLGGGADQLGNLFAGLFHALLGLPSKGVVAAGSVAELHAEVGHHRFEHAGVQRRGGVVVHVDRQVHALGQGGRRLGDDQTVAAQIIAHVLTP